MKRANARGRIGGNWSISATPQIFLRDFAHQQIRSFSTLRTKPSSNPCILIDCFKLGTIGTMQDLTFYMYRIIKIKDHLNRNIIIFRINVVIVSNHSFPQAFLFLCDVKFKSPEERSSQPCVPLLKLLQSRPQSVARTQVYYFLTDLIFDINFSPQPRDVFQLIIFLARVRR